MIQTSIKPCRPIAIILTYLPVEYVCVCVCEVTEVLLLVLRDSYEFV